MSYPFNLISAGRRRRGISCTRRLGSAISAGRNSATRTRMPKRVDLKRPSSADWTRALRRTLPLSRSCVRSPNSSGIRSPMTFPHWTSASTLARPWALSWKPSWRSLTSAALSTSARSSTSATPSLLRYCCRRGRNTLKQGRKTRRQTWASCAQTCALSPSSPSLGSSQTKRAFRLFTSSWRTLSGPTGRHTLTCRW